MTARRMKWGGVATTAQETRAATTASGGRDGLDITGLLLTGRRLPQHELVPLRVDDPGELAVLRLVELIQHVAALVLERLDERTQVRDAIVDHERGLARRKRVAPGIVD